MGETIPFIQIQYKPSYIADTYAVIQVTDYEITIRVAYRTKCKCLGGSQNTSFRTCLSRLCAIQTIIELLLLV